MARKPGTGKSTWNIHEALETPGVAVSSESRSVRAQMRRQKSIRIGFNVMLWGLIPIASISAIGLFVNATDASGAGETVSSATVNDSVGKAQATLTLRSWLGAEPAPIPDATVVTWDGFTVREAPEPTGQNEKKPSYVEELHAFTVEANGIVYDAEVLVLVDGDFGVKQVGTPSLLPRPTETGAKFDGETAWFGYSRFTPSTEVVNEIENWAADFTSGVPSKLKSRVGDGSKDTSYLTLTGAESATVRVVQAGRLILPEDDPAADLPPSQVIVRVELVVQWEGQSAATAGEADQQAPITFDLLVDGADTSAPRVVSWGGPGSGPELKRYSVGLKGVTLSDSSSSRTPTESAATEGDEK